MARRLCIIYYVSFCCVYSSFILFGDVRMLLLVQHLLFEVQS